MHTGVNLGVVVGALRHAPEPVHFGQQSRQRAATTQHIEHARRRVLHQALGQFLPDALGHQMVGFAAVHHLAHQVHGLGCHREIGKARRKACHAQDAYRVFAEGGGDVAQHFGPEVAATVIGVNQCVRFFPARRVCGVSTNRHRIDCEVAPRQVFFQRHIRCCVHCKAMVARAGLALGTGQRVFLVGLRVQEHREVLAHRQEAFCDQCVGRGAHHHPVAIGAGLAQQGIAHRATDQVDLHLSQRACVLARKR